jgi:predicted ATPase with chaperone activity
MTTQQIRRFHPTAHVEVEVNASGQGEQTFTQIVGLPDAAVRESRERVKRRE